MAIIHPQTIKGNWCYGIVLDIHTTNSINLGVDEAGHNIYDTKRSEIGELLYRFKYKNDQNAAEQIIAAASRFLLPHRAKLDLIVPVPPSKFRIAQPVILLAQGIGTGIGIPVVQCVRTTRPTTQLKEVTDPDKRKELLAGLYAVDPTHTAGRNILLFDDLFRSGATMTAITDVLLKAGKAASVRALAITRTRSNR